MKKARVLFTMLVSLLLFLNIGQYMQIFSSIPFSFEHTFFSNTSYITRRIFIFFGTRPEIIKLAPLIITLQKSSKFAVYTVFTGQHSDIIDPFLSVFKISVDIRFSKTFAQGQPLSSLFGKIMIAAEAIKHKPNDIWIVQGDTSSALAIAMVGFHRKICVAHVEAGLRTFDMQAPFPEEFNRKTISTVASLHFAPTVSNANNLINEGIDESKIYVTGNTVIDAAKILEENNLLRKPDFLKSKQAKYIILVTIHRRENKIYFDDLYSAIALSKCLNCLFVIPIHPNPIAKISASKICVLDKRFLCVSPLPYQELHWLLKHADLVVSDSGGIQEEVTWYWTPLLVLRNVTERKEAIESGIAFIVNKTNIPLKIDGIISKGIDKNNYHDRFPFGNGDASIRIERVLNDIDFTKINSKTQITPRLSNYLTFALNYSDRYILKNQILIENSIKAAHTLQTELFRKQKLSIAVILQVYKRNTLKKQLEFVVNQSFSPSTIVIVQNGHYYNVSSIIYDFRNRYRYIEFLHIASSKNMRFHWRFHVAFIQKEKYVSIWDDDVYAKKQWLEHSLEYSRQHNFAVVGANCRLFQKIDLKANILVQREKTGRCDFVGHIWTMPRHHLASYVAMEPLTTYTGEDVQLAFALQKQGIEFHKPPMTGERYAGDLVSHATDKHSSWKKSQSPRTLLFCRLFLNNFTTLECSNCYDEQVLEKCLDINASQSDKIEEHDFKMDSNDNVKYWS